MAVTGISANRAELLQIADAVAREKSIEREVVVEAIEEAMMRGAKARYGNDHDIRAHMDPKTGELTLTRVVTVMPDELVENDYAQVRLSDALKTDPQAFVDKEYVEVLPPMELGRVQTQMARQTGAAEGPGRRA
jgi:N utilization substance protein A